MTRDIEFDFETLNEFLPDNLCIVAEVKMINDTFSAYDPGGNLRNYPMDYNEITDVVIYDYDDNNLTEHIKNNFPEIFKAIEEKAYLVSYQTFI